MPSSSPPIHGSKPAPTLHNDNHGRLRTLADLGWLVWLVAGTTPLPCALWVAVALGQGLLVPVQLGATKALIDALAAQLAGHAGRHIVIWLGLLVAVLLLQRALGGVAPWLQAIARERSGAALQERVMGQAAGLDLAAFEHQGYYDQLNQVLSDADTRGPQLLQQALQLVQIMPALAGYAVALATLSPVLVVITLAVKLPLAVAYGSSGQRNWRLLRGQTRDRRLADYYAGILLGRGFAKEVRLYGLADHLLDRWSLLFRQSRDVQRRAALFQGLGLRAGGAASTGAIMLGLWWVIAAGLLRAASAGSFALLFQSIEGLMHISFNLSGTLRALGEQSGYAGAFRAFLRLPTGRDEGIRRKGDEEKRGMASRPSPTLLIPSSPYPPRIAPSIAFEEVWFTYPGSDRPALAGVSFTLGARETVALVGENGAGKTTIVKLLLGLYQPDAGRVLLDGVDVQAIAPSALRATMSAVFQQFMRYPLNVAENVGIGQPERMDDRRRLAAAVAQAGASEIMARLPDGDATLLGPDVGGVDLSGGQWQRVALARGFFREAQVLVLDEPTAALDPLAELAIFERFAELAAGKTALLISHRLGMARLADRVLVLAHGRVVEQGPHDTLVTAGGEYATLFGAQARWYV
jgi:ATP-binding cassette subfamily B protein